MTIKSNCTDAELSAAVAEYVAGWPRVEIDERGKVFGFRRKIDSFPSLVPPFATSADAVLPLLEKAGCVREIINSDTGLGTFSGWRVEIFVREGPERHVANDQSLPRAICFALLKANGWTVEEAK